MLKNQGNDRNGRYFIKENMTLQRRLLRDKARDELTSYPNQWVRNGSIFVKKDMRSRPIRIESEAQLEKLISEQNNTPLGIPTNHRQSFVKALKLQKTNQEHFDFDRVSPFLLNSAVRIPELDSLTDFPPLPILSSEVIGTSSSTR